MQYFWTADEHYGHSNILKYCKRPFSSAEEMDEEIIKRHNAVVSRNDTVIHVGDFTLKPTLDALAYTRRLNGTHVFLRGSHDRWLGPSYELMIVETKVDRDYLVVACHYAMRVWPKSHYGSWMVYGHSHGGLPPLGKQHDVGVDNNNFTPVSFEELRAIMETRDDNPNLLKDSRRGLNNA